MSRYRNIHCFIWNDDKFPFLPDDCKLVFFHLLTTTLSSAFGFYKASPNALSDEIRWKPERYAKAFRELLGKGFFRYDERYYLILLPNFLRYNPPTNPNVLRSWRHSLKELPDGKLKDEFFQILKVFIKDYGEDFQKAYAEAFEQACRKKGDTDTVLYTDSVSVSFKEEEYEKEKNSGKKQKPSEEAKKKFEEFVYLTDEQHTGLIEKYGDDGTKERIHRLNIYIGKKGEKNFYKKYSSCYHCILDWYNDLEGEEKNGRLKQTRRTLAGEAEENRGGRPQESDKYEGIGSVIDIGE